MDTRAYKLLHKQSVAPLYALLENRFVHSTGALPEDSDYVESGDGADLMTPLFVSERLHVVRLERPHPGSEDRRLGVEDEPVEIEHDGSERRGTTQGLEPTVQA